MDQTFTALLGRTQRFDASPGPDGRIRIGLFDRLATTGQKIKEGEESVFNAETLGQMVENWYARGGRLAMCQDHKSAATPYVSAPALAFYDALAVVDGGQVVRFRKLADSTASEPDVGLLQQSVQRFATDENPDPSPDGLWGFRCEITPLSEDPKEGLRNYRGVSPMFVTDGKDEQDHPIGYVLFDVAATNTAFQAGCELTFSRKPQAPTTDRMMGASAPTGRSRRMSGAPPGDVLQDLRIAGERSQRLLEDRFGEDFVQELIRDGYVAAAPGMGGQVRCTLTDKGRRAADAHTFARAGGSRTTMAAADWYAKISGNVDDWYAGRISYEEFGRRARALWDAVPPSERDAVNDLIRRNLPAAQAHAALVGRPAPRTMAAGDVPVDHAPKYKQGDRVWVPGERNPITIVEQLGEADTGRMQDGRWIKDWLYRVTDAKGYEMRMWLSALCRRGATAMDRQGAGSSLTYGDYVKVHGQWLIVTGRRSSGGDLYGEDAQGNPVGPIDVHQVEQVIDATGTPPSGFTRRTMNAPAGVIGWPDRPPRPTAPALPTAHSRATAMALRIPPWHFDSDECYEYLPDGPSGKGGRIVQQGWGWFAYVYGTTGQAREIGHFGTADEAARAVERTAATMARRGSGPVTPPTSGSLAPCVRGGIRGQLLRRYHLDGAAWLLVQTGAGVLSWPASEAHAA